MNKYAVTPDLFAEGAALSFEAEAIAVGHFDNRGRTFTSARLTPSQITGNQNDYNPAGILTTSVLRLSSDASRNITGLVPGIRPRGKTLFVLNVGSNNIVLKDADTGSAAANRFALNGDVTLAADEGILIWYDDVTARWRPVAQKVHDQAHTTADHTYEADAVKTADETVNNSDTLQNDNQLLFAMGAADETWGFEAYLRITTTTTADFKFTFTVPSSSSIHIAADMQRVAADGVHTNVEYATGDGTGTYTVAGDAVCALRISGAVLAGGAGNVRLQWAQGTATLVNTTVHRNSWIKARRLD